MKALFIFFLTVYFLLSGIIVGFGRDSVKYDKGLRYRVAVTYVGNGQDKIRDITYYDGFGRVLQETAVNGHPLSHTDIVRGCVYDAAGRVVREYLPFGLPGNGGAFVRDIASPRYRGVYDVKDRAYAFGYYEYEPSPLGRACGSGLCVAQRRPGHGDRIRFQCRWSCQNVLCGCFG